MVSSPTSWRSPACSACTAAETTRGLKWPSSRHDHTKDPRAADSVPSRYGVSVTGGVVCKVNDGAEKSTSQSAPWDSSASTAWYSVEMKIDASISSCKVFVMGPG